MSARILIIEDNPTNMELMEYLLNAFGYSSLQACDGEQGIEIAQRELPDLVVCDIHLPKRDAVIAALKSSPRLAAVPVLAVTALAMVGDREKLLAAGFDGYISKPIEPETFVGQVEKFLRADLRALHAAGGSAAAVDYVPTTVARRATILVVDDLPVNRELVRSTLEPMGYVLLLAASVRQAWDIAQREKVDLILSDLHMPDQDGFDFIRNVRAEPRLAGVPFLFLTASSGGPADGQLAMRLGASRFLRRPIEPQTLVDQIEACLQYADEHRSAPKGI
jgi:two-component system cell cycle response regulator